MTTEIAGDAHASLDDDALFETLANPAETETVGAQAAETEAPVAAAAPAEPEARAEGAVAAQETVKEPPQSQETHRVPLRELLDERDKRQALERQIADLQRQIPKPDAPKAPEFWEQPENSVDHRVQQAIAPLQQALVAQQEMFSRARAEDKFGADVVNAAFKDLQDRFAAGDPSARFDQQRVMATPHPFGSLVELYRERQAVREFGTDPAAYKERLAGDLLKDPAFLARAIEAANASARQNTSVVTAAPRAPQTTLSVSRIGAAASIGASSEDLDDDALFDMNVNAR
ncbi:MAG: hypothetical protein JSS66_19000 [Armatimonadetes bacterium]|nr:hypothetical protein [Armatimonadota bacterium]